MTRHVWPLLALLACAPPVDTTDPQETLDSEPADSEPEDSEPPTPTPEEAYCTCVFATCHEHYHARWGEDEVASAAACRAEAAEILAEVDGPQTLECRTQVCVTAPLDDPDDCPIAVGDVACAD